MHTQVSYIRPYDYDTIIKPGETRWILFEKKNEFNYFLFMITARRI